MNPPQLVERRRLEQSFARVRWLGAAALVALAILGGADGRPLWAPALALALGNLAIWNISRRVGTVAAQQRLGVSASALDAAVAWSVAVLVSAELVPSIYALFILVAAELSVRYAPRKGFMASAALVAALAGAMALRGFDALLFLFWMALVVLAGTLVGTAVREVYRFRPTLPLPSTTGLDPALLQLLTHREQQVLAMISEGESNAHIAGALNIELKTVKNHINSIYSKLQVHSRYEAIARSVGQRRGTQTDTTQEESYAKERVYPLR